mgnify:CR=1 FL=1|tara:strand:- start:161 stop:406 length:246 start_codon:yes stop_codon:yes gene_type:complete
MALWSINKLAEYVRGQLARGRDRFSFVAENGDMFDVTVIDGGISVSGFNHTFGLVMEEADPMDEWGSSDSWGHDPGDEHMG